MNTLIDQLPDRLAYRHQQERRERDRRALEGCTRVERYQRSGRRALLTWAVEQMPAELGRRLAAVRKVRAEASRHYSRYGYTANASLTAAEYEVCLAIATAAGCSFEDATDLLRA